MLVLVRHGQTEANASGLLLGRSDPPLTALGRRQAQALGPAVAGARAIVSSPLGRARQTAEALGLDLAVQVDERWIELDYGDYDGRAVGEVPDDVWRRWRSDPSFTPNGGESMLAMGERVRSACADLATRAVDDDVVVVSHVSPIKAAVAWALGVDDSVAWRMFLGVASVTRIAVGQRGPSLRSYNESHHLVGIT